MVLVVVVVVMWYPKSISLQNLSLVNRTPHLHGVSPCQQCELAAINYTRNGGQWRPWAIGFLEVKDGRLLTLWPVVTVRKSVDGHRIAGELRVNERL